MPRPEEASQISNQRKSESLVCGTEEAPKSKQPSEAGTDLKAGMYREGEDMRREWASGGTEEVSK